MSDALVIAGPTASGKSAVALRLAQILGGEIINADAMQVYQELRVLTARPSKAEEAMVPHHLYGVATGDDAYSAGRYARAAAAVVAAVRDRGRLPIIVGGTGLWLQALTRGLSPIPSIPDKIMRAADERIEDGGLPAFRAEVLAVDSAMEWLAPNDRQRHIRAWAVYQATGQPLSAWQAVPPQPVTDAAFAGYVLCPDREVLYQQCDARLRQMLDQGALDEVRLLMDKGLDATAPVMKAVGVPELTGSLEGTMGTEAAIAAAQQATRRLAKRQMTWFRGQAGDWPRYDDADALVTAIIATRSAF